MFRRTPAAPAAPPGLFASKQCGSVRASIAALWAALNAVWAASVSLGHSLVGCSWTAASTAAARALAPACSAWRALLGSKPALAVSKAGADAWTAVRTSKAAVAAAKATAPACKAAAKAAAAAHARAVPLLALAQPYFAAARPFTPYALAAAAALAVYSPPVLLARLAQRLTGVVFDSTGLGKRPRGGRKFVALTIDDGPCPHTTASVLEVLAEHGARATMFVIGSHVEEIDTLGAAAGKGELGKLTLREIVAQGHELGNHTWCVFLSPGRWAWVGACGARRRGGSRTRRMKQHSPSPNTHHTPPTTPLPPTPETQV
jgi:hypothetical protein